MLKWFEKLVDPYPSKGLTEPLPTRFFPFVWQAATGVRPYLLLLSYVLPERQVLKQYFMQKLAI